MPAKGKMKGQKGLRRLSPDIKTQDRNCVNSQGIRCRQSGTWERNETKRKKGQEGGKTKSRSLLLLIRAFSPSKAESGGGEEGN